MYAKKNLETRFLAIGKQFKFIYNLGLNFEIDKHQQLSTYD